MRNKIDLNKKFEEGPKCGDFFTRDNNDDQTEVYILAMISKDLYCLIGLSVGNRQLNGQSLSGVREQIERGGYERVNDPFTVTPK